jgi:hypothetical protein
MNSRIFNYNMYSHLKYALLATAGIRGDTKGWRRSKQCCEAAEAKNEYVGSWCQVKYRRDPQVRKLFMYFRRSMG